MKKYIYMVLTICILVLFAGCKKTESNADDQTTVLSADVTYEPVKELEIPQATLYWYRSKGNYIYVSAVSVSRKSAPESESNIVDSIDEEGLQQSKGTKEERVSGIYRYHLDGSNMVELGIPQDLPDVMDIVSVFDYDAAENIYYMYEDASAHMVIVKCSRDGVEIARSGSDGAFDFSDKDIRPGFCVQSDGTVILHSENAIYLLDEKLALKDTIPVKKGNIYDVVLSQAEEIVCVLHNVKADEVTCQISIYNSKKKAFGEYHSTSIRTEDTIVSGGIGGYTLYYSDGYSIFGYDVDMDMAKKVFDYVLSESTSDVIPLQNGCFFGAMNTGEANESLAVYQKKAMDGTAQKDTLVLATFEKDTELTDAVYQFNKTHSDIEIVINDYAGSVDKMATEITIGNIPDIYDLQDISVTEYVKNGFLENLTAYYEEDEMLNMEEFLPSVVQAMRVQDGIYYVSDGFDIATIAAKVEDVGTGSGWDYAELESVLQHKHADAKFFFVADKTLLLRMMLWCNLSDFVNKETGTCDFNSDDFKTLLKICNIWGGDDDAYPSTVSETELLQEGKVLFRDASSDVDLFKETLAMFSDDVNFIGYPCRDKKGNYIRFHLKLGISSKSDHKKEAWEFLRYFMTKEYQGTVMSMSYLPTRKDCFDLWMEAQTAEEDYTNEMGRQISVRRGKMDIDGIYYDIMPLTEKQAAQYRNMVEHAVKSIEPDNSITEIVLEEAQAYFAGDKSIEVVTDAIQKRVMIYVNE